MRTIVLASTSPYRRALLERLRLPFHVARPAVDEAALPGEPPAATAKRLAQAKARAVAVDYREALIIGADQVADVNGTHLGKPGNFTAALAQLEQMQGRTVMFHTAVAVLDAASGDLRTAEVPTRVRFRTLPRAALEAYLRLDEPYDCAGAAKIESAGIALVESVEADDPTALIGLPLISLTSLLSAFGVFVLPR
ncbi:MAG: Maf family nucleotide pyrophosphatase [Sutterellaceae bacterium]|nr:Maf family nucleotide pyrophosphatase [Burkholderiaceae bacterium]MCX7900948.1 Maf family nucleotide pyrophosphatase [Burkholderiaceae bacterium]MDW8429827.1 Maf family nucleotide pyrophosphatase [Sutterellaceae bacterium]